MTRHRHKPHETSTTAVFRNGSASFDPGRLEAIYKTGEAYERKAQLSLYGSFPTATLISEVENALAEIPPSLSTRVPNGVNDNQAGPANRQEQPTLLVASRTTRDTLGRQVAKPNYAESDIDEDDPDLEQPAESIETAQELTRDVSQTLNRLNGHISECRRLIGDAIAGLLPDSELSRKLPLPGQNECTAALAEMFSACWGPQWRLNCSALGSEGLLTALNSLGALVASCLMKHVCNEGSTWSTAVCKQADIFPTESVADAFFDIRSSDSVRQARGRQAANEIFARAIVAAIGEEDTIYALSYQSRLITTTIIDTLAPHILSLTTTHQYSLSQDWQAEFSEDMFQIVWKAMSIVLELSRSPYTHTFFWANSGDVFHQDFQIYEARGDEHDIVAFTLLPGARLKHRSGNVPEQIMQAEVVTRSSADVMDLDEEAPVYSPLTPRG